MFSNIVWAGVDYFQISGAGELQGPANRASSEMILKQRQMGQIGHGRTHSAIP